MPCNVTHAMVFAAGLGTRMRPLTLTIPKPMVSILGKPLIDYRIEKLVETGVQTIVVNTHYLAEQIEQHVQSHYDHINIILSHEEVLLDTAGGLAKALPFLGQQPFFTTNSDTIWIDNKTPALERMKNFWNPDIMDILLLLHPKNQALGYKGAGDFNCSKEGELTKTSKAHDYVYTGVMLVKPNVFDGLSATPHSLRDILFKRIDPQGGELHRVYGIVHDGAWLHIDEVNFITQAEEFLNKTC